MAPGDPVPDFCLPATSGKTFCLEEHLGHPLVLYFYPKDNTPGCSTEAQEFRDLHDAFRRHGAEIFGISRDSLKSHENFKAKYALPFELLADVEGKVCALFGVLKLKNMYGRKVQGIERSTFLVGPDGRLKQIWRGVKAAGHARAVLDALASQ